MWQFSCVWNPLQKVSVNAGSVRVAGETYKVVKETSVLLK